MTQVPNQNPNNTNPMPLYPPFPPQRLAQKVGDCVRTSLLLIFYGVVGVAGLAGGYVALRAIWRVMQLGIAAVGG